MMKLEHRWMADTAVYIMKSAFVSPEPIEDF